MQYVDKLHMPKLWARNDKFTLGLRTKEPSSSLNLWAEFQAFVSSNGLDYNVLSFDDFFQGPIHNLSVTL